MLTLCSAILAGAVYEIIKIKHPGHALFRVKASCYVQRLIINRRHCVFFGFGLLTGSKITGSQLLCAGPPLN